jgi:hypothetical protein
VAVAVQSIEDFQAVLVDLLAGNLVLIAGENQWLLRLRC